MGVLKIFPTMNVGLREMNLEDIKKDKKWSSMLKIL